MMNEDQKLIFWDVLGGDASPETKTGEYEGDAALRNLKALKIFLVTHYSKLVAGKVKFVLFGRGPEIREAIQKALDEIKSRSDQAAFLSSQVEGFHMFQTEQPFHNTDFLQIVESEEQTPMGGKKPVPGTSMAKMFRLAEEQSPYAVFTAGSTAAQVAGSLKFRGTRGRPFISKNIMPGIEFGDNGAIPKPKIEDFTLMLTTLKEHAESDAEGPIMILPSDSFSPQEIQDQIQSTHGVCKFLDFDPLSEIGLNGSKHQPSVVLSDGFIGNLHLKFIELLYRQKSHFRTLSNQKTRDSIKSRIHRLEGSTQEGWKTPQSQGPFYILCNGTEDSKGTPELKELVKEIRNSGQKAVLVEPSFILENPDSIVYATPASKILADAFFEESLFWKAFFNPRRAWNLSQARKKSVAMAEILNLKKGTRVFAAHGAAPVEDTIKNLKTLLDMALSS